MAKEYKNKLFGVTPTVPSEGEFKVAPVNDADLASGSNYQARAKITLSDGSEVFTNATTFQTPGIATTTPAPTTPAPTDGSITTTLSPEPSLTAQGFTRGNFMVVRFTPTGFSDISKTTTEISWFLTQGSVRSTYSGKTSDFYPIMTNSVIVAWEYEIPLSRFSAVASEYTFLVKTSGSPSATATFTWVSPGVATTTTTTTTTDSPLDIVVETNDLIECPCGEIKFPKGGHYYGRGQQRFDSSTDWFHFEPNFPSHPNYHNYGLRVMVKEGETTKDYGLIHNDYVYLKSEETFVTLTDNISDSITPDKLILYFDTDVFYRMVLENVISITVKDEANNKTLGHKQFGAFGTRQKIKRSSFIDKPSFVVNLTGTTNLQNNALMLVIKSLCQYDYKPCCDSLPKLMRVNNSGDAQYGKKGSGICIPMDMFYTGEEINYITTTTKTPEEVSFVDQLSVELGASEAKLSAKMNSSYGSNIKYWWELTSTSPVTKLTTIQTAKPNEVVTFTDKRSGNATYRIAVVHPQVVQSNSVTVNIPTTPAPTTTTSTTVSPPTTPAPLVTSISFNDIGDGNGFDSDITFLRCLPRIANTTSGADIKKTIDLYTDINSRYETIKLEVDATVINASGPTTYEWKLFDVEANCGTIVSDINWDLIVARPTQNPWLYVDSAKDENNTLVDNDIKYYIVRCTATNNNVSAVADLLYFRNY